MQIVFDSSTLILLAKTELLREIADEFELTIPEGVRKECAIKESIDAKLIEVLIKEKKIAVKKAGSPDAVRKIRHDFRIESGEAEAFWLAQTLNCPIATDDGPTIKACKVLGLKFVTAIHFLLMLTSQDKIELTMAIEKLEKLSRYGRYSKRIIEDAANRLKGGKQWV